MDRWSRRQFVQGVGVAGLGLLAGCGRWPGQEPASPKMPRIGVLVARSEQVEAFRQGLRDFGYAAGDNVVVQWRSSESAPDLAQSPFDVVVVAGGTPDVLAAKAATNTIPIIMTGVG